MLVGGDIIVAIDGQRIDGNRDRLEFLETKTKVGQSVVLTVVRGGELMEVALELGEAPQY